MKKKYFGIEITINYSNAFMLLGSPNGNLSTVYLGEGILEDSGE